MARRLAQVSLYLNGLLVDLQQGNDIEPARLSWHCDYLLGLLDEDRQDLLFAVHCLVDDPPLVKHCIAVAVRLADLARSRGLPNDLVKAICACALIHDLGKALLPPELLRSESLDREQREILGRHVTLLRERLGQCKWLAEPVIGSVVEQINERLDGSGYPHGLRGEQFGELARMAAVVDVIDAMGRPRPDRPEQAISSVYRRLIGCEAQLDRRWCQHYIQHFGLIPVGSLVRFAEGDLAWVERLDRKGGIAQVRLADQSGMRGATLSAPLSGDELAALGPIEGIVIPGS
ncbi:HD-GYP domain-containing protein [Azotobacter sp. CWF10]